MEDKLAEGLGVAVRRDADAAKSGQSSGSTRASLHSLELFLELEFSFWLATAEPSEL